MGLRPALIVLGLALMMAPPASSQTVVADGDTLSVAGTNYRLWSVDAPESAQTCKDGWPAGLEAIRYLRTLVRDKTVSCLQRTFDSFGVIVALCRANGQDLGAAMVRAGMAWAFVRYSHDYTGLEQMAKRERYGVHHHGCEPPWQWRAMQRR